MVSNLKEKDIHDLKISTSIVSFLLLPGENDFLDTAEYFLESPIILAICPGASLVMRVRRRSIDRSATSPAKCRYMTNQ